MAGTHSLETILGWEPITGLVQATMSGIPNTLPPQMMQRTQEVLGNSGFYVKVKGERRTSRLTKYGAPSVTRELKEIGDVPIKLLHSFESQPIDPLTFQKLRNYTDHNVQRQGKQEVARQVKEFAQLFGNLRIAVAQQTLANGVIYVDSSNRLLPNSGGAAVTHDFGMAAAHQNQFNNGTSSIITDPWDDPTTDIPQQLLNLQVRAAEETGYVPEVIFYGKAVGQYVLKNDFIVEYLARYAPMSGEVLKKTGIIPQGLLGWTWIPCHTMFYEADDGSGTKHAIWNENKCTFTPSLESLSEWWDVLEGSYCVPSTLDIMTQVNSLDSMKTVYGGFGFARMTIDPPGVTNYMGDTFAFALRNPDAIWQGIVAGF